MLGTTQKKSEAEASRRVADVNRNKAPYDRYR